VLHSTLVSAFSASPSGETRLIWGLPDASLVVTASGALAAPGYVAAAGERVHGQQRGRHDERGDQRTQVDLSLIALGGERGLAHPVLRIRFAPRRAALELDLEREAEEGAHEDDRAEE
jgi:hypothetical protein